MDFRTHKGEVFAQDSKALIDACHKVACDFEANAKASYDADAYAAHVTQEQKETLLATRYAWADDVRQRKNLHNFTVWQRVNAELTGECVPFFNETKGE